MRAITIALTLLLATAAQARAPQTSLRPVERGGVASAAEQASEQVVTAALATSRAHDPDVRPVLRPVPRPFDRAPVPNPVGMAETSDVIAMFTAASLGTGGRNFLRSLQPHVRPKAIEQKAMAKRRARNKGAICGDVDLQGDVVGAVPGRISGCGIKGAVKLRSVSGVTLSQAALMDCGTAKALKKWVNKGVKPAFGNKGGGIAKLRVAAHYACRTRNNQPGAKISEHGKGRAIDISAFILRDGTTVDVLNGWRSKAWRKPLAKAHKAACGPFGTVLGPKADRFHQDHFHMDTARYRSGGYCR